MYYVYPMQCYSLEKYTYPMQYISGRYTSYILLRVVILIEAVTIHTVRLLNDKTKLYGVDMLHAIRETTRVCKTCSTLATRK